MSIPVRSINEVRMQLGEGGIPRLYRHVLKLAKVFPSSNKDGLIKEIKLKFHEGKAETDPAKVEDMVQHGLQGKRQLSMYKNMEDGKGGINIHLEQNYFVKLEPGQKYVPPPHLARQGEEMKLHLIRERQRMRRTGQEVSRIHRDD